MGTPTQSNRPLSIYLGDLTYTTLSLATDAFPLNVGFIAAYAKKVYGNDIDIRLFKYIPDLEQALAENAPDILGLSNYPWNFNLGLEFFRMAHQISPKTICVMGGPNIPLDDEPRKKFVRRYPEIDFYSYLEGEEAFCNLIARAFETGVDRTKMRSAPIDGFIHRVSDSEVMCGTMLARRRDLDEIPSPYLTGLMDKFFDGIHLIGGEVPLQRCLNGFGVGGVIELDVDGRNQTVPGVQFLHSADVGERPRKLALFDDTRDSPVVAEIDGISRLKIVVLFSENFIDHQVIGTLEQTALDDLQAAAHRIEFVQMNTGDGVE